MAHITAAVLEQGSWMLKEVESTLAAKQALVGGYIEVVPIEDDTFVLFANEDGIALGLKPTVVWMDAARGIMEPILGPVAAFGPQDEEGYVTSATPAVIKALERHLVPVVLLTQGA